AQRIIGFRVKGTGEIRWSLLRSMPVMDAGGGVVQAINVFRDVTDRRAFDQARERVQRHLSFLNEATRALDEGPLDAESRLARLARVAVPSLGTWCAVYFDEGGEVRLRTFAHVDPKADPSALQAPSTLSVPLRVRGRTLGALTL